MNVQAFVGRCLLAALFMVSGVTKVANLAEPEAGGMLPYMTPKINNVLGKLGAAPLPAEYYLYMLGAAAVMELAGSIFFICNLSFGAWILALFLVPTTAIMHNFWDLEEHTAQHQIEVINFMKNLSILGGLLVYLSMPRGFAASKVKIA